MTRKLSCPCCGQPTDAPGVRLNAIASARARVVEARSRYERLSRTAVRGGLLKDAHNELLRAQAELDALTGG